MIRALFTLVAGWLLSCQTTVIAAQSTIVGGPIASNTTWTASMNPVLIKTDLTIPTNLTLRIEAGVIVKVFTNIALHVEGGGTLEVAGSAVQPVSFSSEKADEKWGPISADGPDSVITIRHAEISHGNLLLNHGATGLIEDSFLHDIPHPITANSASFVTLRRIHVRTYTSIAFNAGTTILAEDSLFEGMSVASSDALEIQEGPVGSIIRRCTFRHSTGTNSDALDFNGCTGVLVEDCLIYDFSDKGISLGAAAVTRATDHDIIVRNCSIYSTGTGIALKDGGTASLYNNTITKCASGLRLYQKFADRGGGNITDSQNNIVAGNTTNVVLLDGSTLLGDHNDFQAQPLPGTGNTDVDPIFLNSTQNDFRLAPASPLFNDSRRQWGTLFPVGAFTAPSHPTLHLQRSSPASLTLSFWADSEKNYSLLATDQLQGPWQPLQTITKPAVPTFISLPLQSSPGPRFFHLVVP